MPDIGMIELILIGIVGFLVLGPERLPSFLAQVAKVVREGRLWLNNLKMQLDQEKQYLTKPMQQVKEEMSTAVQEVSTDVAQVKEEMQTTVQPPINETVKEQKDK